MNFDTFREKCPWRIKKILYIMDLYHPDCFMVGNFYPIGSVVIHHNSFYIKTEDHKTKDMWFDKRCWTEFITNCVATNMPCIHWNCALYYTKEVLLKEISIW